MSDRGNMEQGDEEANISSCQTSAPNCHSESDDVPNTGFTELPKVEGVSVIPDAKYSSHTLKVEWKPIDEQDVKYTVVCSTNAGDVSKPPEESLEMNTDNNETSIILTNLEEGTRYYIWVKAESTQGRAGPWSDRTIGAICPMTEWHQAALVALQGNLKLNVKMIQLSDMLERPAGGFMDRAEVLRVNAKAGDMEQMGELINILLGKEDMAFYTFCDLLQRCNYEVWARELKSAAERLKTVVPKLDHSNFMPFAFDFDEDQSRTTWRGERERLEWLLQLECKDPEHWKKEAVKLLWEEGENQADVKIQEVALRLKNAVWTKYRKEFEELPKQERGLFWVLDATLPPMPKKKKPKQATLNTFSFRALFWAVLRGSTEEELNMENDQGLFPIHYAAKKLLPDAVLYLLSYGADVNKKSESRDRTALHYAVRFRQHGERKRKQKILVQVLKAFKADHSLPDAVRHVPLFNAILTEDIDLVKLLIDYAPINHADDDGDTHLHIAAEWSLDQIACLLIANGAGPELRNNKGLTPFHIAAQKSDTCLKAMSEACIAEELEIVDIFSQKDDSKHTPLDYAAIHSHQDTFHYMWKHIQGHPNPDIASYKPVLDRLFLEDAKKIRFATLQQTLEGFSKPDFQSYLTTDTDRRQRTETEEQSASLYNLLQSEPGACLPVVNTVLDKCLYGDKVVVSKVLDSGPNGEYPPKSNHDAVLRTFVSSHYASWGHPTMKIWINDKWNQFGLWILCLFAYFHFIQWLALTIALSLAIRPGVTDEALNYYNTPLDGLRGFVEGVVILMWMVKIGNELHKVIVLRPKIYFMDIFVYVNIAAIILLAITIVLRAVQSTIQWQLFALAYLMYTMLALEYLSLFKWSSTYIQTLFCILKRDFLARFLVVFLVYLVGFAGAFLLALQEGRSNTEVAHDQEGREVARASGGDATNTSTLYIWDALYLGIRVMAEVGNVLGEYNESVGWLAVIFYLAFLVLTVIIMLNVLIAQMSDTYTTVRENARALATYHRARFMLRYLGHYEYWHSKRCGKQQTEENYIIWKKKRQGDGGNRCCAALQKMWQTVKLIFLEDKIAYKQSKHEVLTVHRMEEMMESVKKEMMDLKEETLRHHSLEEEITKKMKKMMEEFEFKLIEAMSNNAHIKAARVSETTANESSTAS